MRIEVAQDGQAGQVTLYDTGNTLGKRIVGLRQYSHHAPELLQALLAYGIALRKIPSQHLGGPAAELHALLRFNPVPHRDDDIKVIEGYRPV